MCPCPYGYFQDPVKERTCSNQVIADHPLLKARLQPNVGSQSMDHSMRIIEILPVDYKKTER